MFKQMLVTLEFERSLWECLIQCKEEAAVTGVVKTMKLINEYNEIEFFPELSIELFRAAFDVDKIDYIYEGEKLEYLDPAKMIEHPYLRSWEDTYGLLCITKYKLGKERLDIYLSDYPDDLNPNYIEEKSAHDVKYLEELGLLK